jgi:CTP:molybdopterin cytidylyltransferase MocA
VSTAAVVLAAGGGSRFAGPTSKLVAPFRGRPLWCWSVAAATDADFADVVVVTGAVDLTADMPPHVHEVHNARWATGQASSLHAAWTWAEQRGHDAVVIGLADQPLVGPDAWRAVGESTATPIAVASFDGDRRPPVRLAASVWALLPEDGDEGARALMRERPELVTAVPCTGQPIDIDTVEDLRRWS